MAVHNATAGMALNPIIAKMKPGDTFVMAPGVYPRQRIWCAIPNVTIEAAGAIIDGAGLMIAPYEEMVSIRASNVVVRGLTVQNSTGEGFGIGDSAGKAISGCKLLGVTTNHTQYNGVTVEKHTDGEFEVTITNSAMMNHPSVRKGGDWPGGIAFVRGSNNNILRNSTISWVWGEPVGIFWNSNGNKVVGCTFFAHWGPFDIDVASGNIISGNFFYNADMMVDGVNQKKQNRAIVIGNEKGTQAQTAMRAGGSSDRNVVENNIIVGYEVAVGFDQQTGAPKTPDSNIVQFNTISGGSVGLHEGGGANNIVRNNIFYKAGIAPVYKGKVYGNQFWQPPNDPGFVNPDGINPTDWQIAPTSLAVGKATEGIPPTDFFGNPRPTPAALGAHEPAPVVIEPATKGWRIPYMVGDETFYLPPPPDVGHVLVSIEDGGFEWQPK